MVSIVTYLHTIYMATSLVPTLFVVVHIRAPVADDIHINSTIRRSVHSFFTHAQHQCAHLISPSKSKSQIQPHTDRRTPIAPTAATRPPSARCVLRSRPLPVTAVPWIPPHPRRRRAPVFVVERVIASRAVVDHPLRGSRPLREVVAALLDWALDVRGEVLEDGDEETGHVEACTSRSICLWRARWWADGCRIARWT